MLFKENRLSEAKDDSLCPMTLKVQSYPSTCLLQIHVNQQYSQQPPQTGQQQKAAGNTSLHTLSAEPFVPTENHTGSLRLSAATLSAAEGKHGSGESSERSKRWVLRFPVQASHKGRE